MSDILNVSREGCVWVLTLNDPTRRNILSRSMCDALSSAVGAACDDAETKAVVIAAEGRAFCAGADLDDLIAASEGDTENVEAVYKSFMDVAACPLPVIAAINGPAVGAGLNLALACDIRLAGEEAMFECRFLKIGLHPAGGHSWLLQRAVSWSDATRMVLLGQKIGPQEAIRIGLAHEVVPSAELRARAIQLANEASTTPRELQTRTKVSMRHAQSTSYLESAEHERVEQATSLQRSAFTELVLKMRDTIRQARP